MRRRIVGEPDAFDLGRELVAPLLGELREPPRALVLEEGLEREPDLHRVLEACVRIGIHRATDDPHELVRSVVVEGRLREDDLADDLLERVPVVRGHAAHELVEDRADEVDVRVAADADLIAPSISGAM